MRYRLNQSVPPLRGRFAHTKFRVAVHALTVRALSTKEIGVLARLNKHEVEDLLSELKRIGAVEHEGAGGAERPYYGTLATMFRWLRGS